jgi:nucleotide-binding universal stress UspA family protein
MFPLPDLHYRRLLVAVDDSPGSALALAAAIDVARREHAALTLVSVAPDIAATAARWPGPGVSPPQLQDEADAAVQRTLREAVEAVPEEIGVTTVFRRGRPGPEIVGLIDEGDFDAVLLGARGVGRVGAFAGSVSAYVMHHATIAVFAAHAPTEVPDTEAEPELTA